MCVSLSELSSPAPSVEGDGSSPGGVAFPCHRWLDRSEDDGATMRELQPAGAVSSKCFPVDYKILVLD